MIKEKESKKTRRGNGEGSIFQRKDNRWCAKIQTGTDENGKSIIKTFYGKERKEVAAKLKEHFLLTSQGYNNLTSDTLKDFITTWLTTIKFNQLKPLSYDRLESTINNHIIPNLGHYMLDKLTSLIIQSDLINKMFDNGMSYSSIKKAFDAINECCEYAVQNRKIIFNPVVSVKKPSQAKFKRKEIEIFTNEEIKKFEESCKDRYSNGQYIYNMGYGLILMLYTGIRMGEALSLKWENVNIQERQITIDGNVILTKNRDKKIKEGDNRYILVDQDTTKTIKGKRSIKLSNKALDAINNLNSIYKYKDNDYIFQTKNKTPIRPRNLQNMLDSVLTRVGISHKGLHVLRHTFASMLFAKGIDVKTVSELLGHADVRITYSTYIHLIEAQKSKAIDLLDD
jgi:integrase